MFGGFVIILSRRPAVIATVTLSALALGGVPAVQAAPARPALRLLVASSSVTLNKYKGSPGVNLNLGTYLAAPGRPFEIRVQRKSYHDPVVATQVIHQEGGGTATRVLPRSAVRDFSGLQKFLHVTLTNAKGKKVVDRDQDACPAGSGNRTNPNGPATSPYPLGCSENPFTLGSVWGIQREWAIATSDWRSNNTVKLADGKYTATITVNKLYRDLFGMPATSKKVQVTVKTVKESHGGPMAAKTPSLKAGARPTGADVVPAGPKPDLRSLPAWQIKIIKNKKKRQYLSFSANVWNAGPSTLVVDGFRTKQNLMDAYQYFYDDNGQEVGHANVGTMEWDPRSGHEHWHFTDFASYRLLKADKTEVVRSQKEAFCLANTDAIDYLVKNANWRPYNTDLQTACGDQSAMSVREVLDVGNGDTYVQDLPGQSFDIHNLPNGTYYIQVIANPRHRLYESNTNNNISLRKVIIGGKKGAHTVKVPPHELVDAP